MKMVLLIDVEADELKKSFLIQPRRDTPYLSPLILHLDTMTIPSRMMSGVVLRMQITNGHVETRLPE